jgi:ABC-type lipoprotein release transport system permease subunit
MPTPTPAATQNSVVNLGLPSGIPEAYDEPKTQSLYQLIVQSTNNLLNSLEQYCGLTQKPMTQWNNLSPSATLRSLNLNRLYCIAGETIAYGRLVNLYNNAGVLTARNAISSDANKRAHGYCNVNNTSQSGMALGQYGEVILGRGIIAVAGVNPGDELFLSASSGQMQVGPDTTAGHIEQFIGFGVATNLVSIDITIGSYLQH